MPKGRTPKGQRDDRVKLVADEICKRGLSASKRMLMRRWRICQQTWETYVQDAYAQLRENNAAVIHDKKAIAISRLERMLATATGKTAVAILREISKLDGLYAPLQQIITNLTPDDTLPDAVSKLLSDPKLLKAQIEADERNLP